MRKILRLLACAAAFLPAGCAFTGVGGSEIAVVLRGASEVPANRSGATGKGTFWVHTDRTLDGILETSGMEATAAHLHLGEQGSDFHLQMASDLAAPTWVQMALSSLSSMATLCVIVLTLAPWAEEERFGTLSLLATSPLAPQIALEKGALAAYFVTLSYLMQQGRWAANTETFATISAAAHLLAVAVGPTWFFFLRAPAVSIGATTIVPAC